MNRNKLTPTLKLASTLKLTPWLKLASTLKLMPTLKLAPTLALGALLILSGCAGGGAGSAGADRNTNSDAQERAGVNDAQGRAGVANNSPAVADTAPSPAAATVVNTASQGQKSSAGLGQNPRQANAPKPQIGSGGNDFYLFTQTRGALAADAELKGTSFTIDVKEGVLTLSGTASSEAQKSRAEQVARGIGGIKAVKNEIKVAGRG